MATRRWRPLAFASVVTATLAGMVVLRAVLNAGDADDAPSAPVDEPTATAPAATAPTQAPSPLSIVTSAVLRKQVFAAGEQISLAHGIGFLSAETGSIETWSAVAATPGVFDSIVPTPDGALLVYYPPGEGQAPLLVERGSGETWKLAPGVFPLPEAAHGALIVVAMRTGDQEQPAVLNIDTGTIAPFGEKQHYLAGMLGLISPDGRRVAMHLGESVALLELGPGRLALLASGINPDAYSLQALPGALGFTIAEHDSEERRWFSWDGRELDSHLGTGAISPNGRYIARQWSPGRIRAVGMGGFPSVSAVTVFAREGEQPVAQFLGASTSSSRASAWGASGETLVLEVPLGYRQVNAAGQTLATIPDEFHVLDPRPSPTISGLLGTNRGTIINTVRGQTIAPKYLQEPWRASWDSKPGELVVQLATPGKGRSWPVDVMPFAARTSGIELEPRIALRPGGCTEVRELPVETSALVECAPAGVTGAIIAVDDPQPDPKADGTLPPRIVGLEDEQLTIWVHVLLVGGAAGWVPAEALIWASLDT